MARALAIDKDGKLCFEKGTQKYGAQPMQLCAACSMSWPADGTRSHCFSERTGPAAVLRFDSTREMNRYLELAFAQKGGAISGLKLQPRFKMPPGFAYVADFEYMENGRKIIEDCKGFETPVFKLKRKCLAYFFPEIELRITR